MEINKHFLRIRKTIKNILPYLGAFIILFVYIGTAILITFALGDRLSNTSIMYPYVISFIIGFGVQPTRMFIVFASQMGIEQVTRKFDVGTIAAFLMTCYAVFELWHISPTLAISGGGLIVSGLISEVIVLRELNKVAKYEIFSNSIKMKELKKSIRNQQRYEREIESIIDQDLGVKNTSEPPLDVSLS